MRAETISVGTELLLGQIVDTDAVELAQVLAECGIDQVRRQTVGDNHERLVEAIQTALTRSDIVVTIGGLGPTEDDITREAVAEALGDSLYLDDTLERELREKFEKRGLAWREAQSRQAMLPDSGHPVENPHGTAPGLFCRKGGKVVIAMPGPRQEFVPMLRGPVQQALTLLGGGAVIRSRTLRVVLMGESLVEGAIGPWMHLGSPTVATYAKPGEVHVRITAKANSEEAALGVIEPVAQEIMAALEGHVYGEDDHDLAAATLDALRQAQATVAVAESCTGGMLGARLTAIPGSSDTFLGGVISYSNEAKIDLLGVPAAIIDQHGAVSPECAKAMAEGVRERLRSDWGASVTGIAGPDGGTAEKPVGLVYIGIASGAGSIAEKYNFLGVRQTVRERSAQMALALLWQRLHQG